MNSGGTLALWRRGYALMEPRERRKALLLAIAVAIAELAQLAASIVVLPVVGVIVQPDLLEKGGKIGWLYSFIGADSRQSFLFMLAGIAFVALLIGHLGMLAVNIALERFGAQLNVRMSRDLVQALVNAPFAWFLGQNAAALTRVVHNDVTYWSRDLIGNGLRILSMVLTLITTTALVVLITPLGGLAMLVLAGVLAGVTTKAVKGPMIRWNRVGRKASEGSMVMTTQILSGIKDVKANRTQEHFTALFTTATAKTRYASAQALILGQIPAAVIMLIMQAGILLVMMGLWWSGVDGGAMAAQMALIVLASARITPAIIRFQTAIGKLINTQTWVAGLLDLLDSARNAAASQPRSTRHATLDSWSAIHFDKVGYTYESGERVALHAVDAELDRGACIGLQGPSGAGKSTFVDLLLGLLSPTQGSIRIDAVALSDIGQDWLHHVGYVPQQPFFTDDTLAANIALGLPRDETRLRAVLAQAGLAEFLDSLPHGLDTPLGDRGQRASGGQRQRIAIARALYREPDLLVLDEATSALDAETEASLVDTLRGLKGAITMVIVSHREAPMVLCDTILAFDEGRVSIQKGSTPKQPAIVEGS